MFVSPVRFVLSLILSGISLHLSAENMVLPEEGLRDLRTSCNPDKISVFGLTPLPTSLPKEGLDWTPQREGSTPIYITPDGKNNIRIEVCEQDDGSYKIHDIMLKIEYRESVDSPPIKMNAKYNKDSYQYFAKNFTEALFGDSEDLRLYILSPDDAIFLKLKGWKIGEQQFTTASFVVQSGNDYLNDVGYVIVGKLEMNDPFPNSKLEGCPIIGSPFSEKNKIGQAEIEMFGCAIQGVGNTTLKSVGYMIVTDSNPQLPAHLQNKPITVKNSSEKRLFDYDSSHHNWCDSFYVSVPELNATYVSYRRPVEGFPFVNDKPFAGQAIKYKDIWTILFESPLESRFCY